MIGTWAGGRISLRFTVAAVILLQFHAAGARRTKGTGFVRMSVVRLNTTALKVIARLYLLSGIILLLFIVAFNIPIIHRVVVVNFTILVTVAAQTIMNLFGADAGVSGCLLQTANFSINIVDGCNGIYPTAVLLAGVLGYKAKLSYKLWGVLLGTAAIFVLNLGRVISLFYLGQHYPDIFEEVHVYVWQPIIIIWAIFVWDFWARRVNSSTEVS
jgi:exosortase H (IPTLxxWG-CTERM-specific)